MHFPWFRLHFRRKRHRYGRLEAKRPPVLRDLDWYPGLVGQRVTPASVNIPPVVQWGMLGNDRFGDCGCAGFIHGCMAAAAITHERLRWPSAYQVVRAYLTYTRGQDRGVVLADYLEYCRTHGFCGNKDTMYAPFDPRNREVLKQVIYEYGFAYVGIRVYEGMEPSPYSKPPWTWTAGSVSGQIMGGHCIVLVGYSAGWIYGVTWGGIVRISWDAWDAMCDEAWGVITGELAAHGGDGRGLGLSILEADLRALEAEKVNF